MVNGELLTQALMLTLYGMGMTFVAIGALVGGMYLLTALVPEKKPETAPETYHETEAGDADAQGRYLAAAAAVAVALAQSAPATAKKQAAATGSTWSVFVRNQHIRQRSHRPHR
ncbi:MAG: OadG family protein [Anaerolineae bacterium]|nr:OadG family protein [Anaerolineae bacterium]